MSIKEKLNKGNVSLFAVAFVAAVLAAVVISLLGGDKLSATAGAAIGGVLSLMELDLLLESEELQLPVGKEAGYLGIICGVIITLIVF